MIIRHGKTVPVVLSAGLLAALAGCAATPMGPTVQAMPGPGKSFDAFQADNMTCKGFANDQVRGMADSANQRGAGAAVLTTVLGTGLGAAIGAASDNAGAGAAIGAASGATAGTAIGASNSANEQGMIQQQYDNAYAQCMYAKGEQIPGYAPIAAAPPPPAYAPPPPVATADPLVRSTQVELNRLGYLHDAADGYIGPKTSSAIAGFEQAQGLPVDGRPSPALLARMQSTPASATATPMPGSATTTASAPTGWVSPTTAAAPAAATAPAAPAGWVAPAR